MKIRLLLAALLGIANPCLAGGFSGDGFGSRGFFQFVTGSAPPPASAMTTPTLGSYNSPTSTTNTFFAPAIGSSTIQSLNTSSIARRVPIPIAGTLKGLFANLNTALTTASVVDWHNTAAGSVGCNFSAATNCNSGAATEPFAAGDFLQWELIPGGTWNQSATTPLLISWLFQATSGASSGFLLSAPSNTAIASTTMLAYQAFGTMYNSANATTEAQVSSLMPTAGSISGLYVISNATENGTNSHIYTLMKNGSATGLTCTPTAGTATGCCINVGGTGNIGGVSGPACTSIGSAVTITDGDTLSLQVSCASGACAGVAPGASVAWNPTTAGQAVFNAQGTTNLGATDYTGMADTGATTTQVTWQVAPQVPTTMTLSGLLFCSAINPGGATSRTATLQSATTPIAPTNSSVTTTFGLGQACPGANSGTLLGGNQDTTHSLPVNAGYSLDTAYTISGSPAAISYWKTSAIVSVP
jgi:hypothetical protein